MPLSNFIEIYVLSVSVCLSNIIQTVAPSKIKLTAAGALDFSNFEKLILPPLHQAEQAATTAHIRNTAFSPIKLISI